MGVSGGEEGARYGPSLMPGGARAAYDLLRPVLESIAARTDSGPCVTYVGPDGAGHFTKMVHLPREIGIIDAFGRRHLELSQVACFDTAFHRGMPPVAMLAPIPGLRHSRFEVRRPTRRQGSSESSGTYLLQAPRKFFHAGGGWRLLDRIEHPETARCRWQGDCASAGQEIRTPWQGRQGPGRDRSLSLSGPVLREDGHKDRRKETTKPGRPTRPPGPAPPTTPSFPTRFVPASPRASEKETRQ